MERPRRRIPEPLIGFMIAVVVMTLVLVAGTRLGWFGDDPTFEGSTPVETEGG